MSMRRLSTFILDNIETILEQWEKFARSLKPGRLMTVAALRDDAEQMLRFVAADIETGQSKQAQHLKATGRGPQLADGVNSAAHTHGSARAVDHFTFAEMVSEYRALRAAVTRMWLDSAGVHEESVVQLVRFNEAIDQVLAESVVRFAATLERESDLFTASVGHDLRNPLNAIVSSAEFVARSSRLPDEERAAAERIVRSANRMTDLVGQLQDYSRTRLAGLLQLSLGPANVSAICRDVIAEIAAAHPTYTLQFSESGDTSVVGDRERLGQLMSNLIGNAVQHGTPSRTISVAAYGDKHRVRIEVHNEGQAIDSDRLQDIFEPLHRATSMSQQKGSLGLGLYIVRRITVAHGGTVSVTSTEADGTTFFVVIPRQPQT